MRWEDHPAHFWLVVAGALAGASLALATGEAASRRGDARLMLISLAFLSGGGFLALHALATPGVLLDGPNQGFVLATPVGLLLGAAFAALSTRDDQGPAALRTARILRVGLLVAMAVWGGLSLAEVPPLDDPTPVESGSGALVVLGVPAVALYAWATWRYLSFYGRRPSPLLLAVALGFLLLAEAMVAVAFARNWQATWWEWHLLMFTSFAIVVVTARREWREERFSDLYLEDTVAGKREVSVVFADLAGFTAFSEQRDPREVSSMLNAYFEAAIPPVVEGEGGEIDRVMGDAIMASFNRRGDQAGPPGSRRPGRACHPRRHRGRRTGQPRLAALSDRGEHGRGDDRRAGRARRAQLHGDRRRRERGGAAGGGGSRGRRGHQRRDAAAAWPAPTPSRWGR